MLTKTKVVDRVWAINSDSQVEIGKAFIRFQEYYENADLKGRKDLTVREIEKWWERTREATNAESYYEYWVGFNLPGRVFVELTMSPEFRPGFSLVDFLGNPMAYPRYHDEENELMALLSDLPAAELVDSYFIGLWKDSTDVLEHEIAHGLFTTNAMYKSEQLYNISKLPADIYQRVRKDLISCGYHPHVVHDEIQAYFSTYVECLEEKFETKDYNQYTAPFQATFKKFYTPS